jgi:hypothetical protein
MKAAYSQAERIGFVYRPPDQLQMPGYSELTINLYSQPIHAFFNTKVARLPVVGQEGGIEQREITHPWHGRKTLRLCLGRIWLLDYAHRPVKAFTWGGTVSISDQDTYTSCRVTSPAPIFDLASANTDYSALVSELEAWLARCRASWGTDDAGFERCLAAIDPSTLLVASLCSLEQTLQLLPLEIHEEMGYESIHQIVHSVSVCLQHRGSWPQTVPTLTDLLNCDRVQHTLTNP